MTVIVFAGPTLPAAAIRERLDAIVLPPAAVGDVARAARRQPIAIGLIDGVFERVLPVWHKEILWAMSRGVHVFGAASMGALRAAELHPFGMRGVGRIFAAYASGEIEADDEVAVLHGPAEVGFAPVTEALVNVRATLDRAVAEGVLAADAAVRLLTRARECHYRERTWAALLVPEDGDLAEPVARLRDWLPEGRVDLKRGDALQLLAAISEFVATDPSPMRPNFSFAWTDAWDALHARIGGEAVGEPVLEELRLQVGRLAEVRRAALLRVLARREAERRGIELERNVRQEVCERLRARLGLWRRAAVERWLAENDIGQTEFAGLVEDEALLGSGGLAGAAELDAAMLAELRATGQYATLAERAHRKSARLAAIGLTDATPAEAGIDLAPHLARLAEGADMPGIASGGGLAQWLGFADRASLEAAVLRELLFVRMMDGNNGGATQVPPESQPIG